MISGHHAIVQRLSASFDATEADNPVPKAPEQARHRKPEQ
jgi:hypothetical protein